MIEQFDVVHREADVAIYLGILSSAFFGARGLSNPFWGWISDHLGRRRPILLLGALGGMTGYVFFGLTRSFTWVQHPSVRDMLMKGYMLTYVCWLN